MSKLQTETVLKGLVFHYTKQKFKARGFKKENIHFSVLIS